MEIVQHPLEQEWILKTIKKAMKVEVDTGFKLQEPIAQDVVIPGLIALIQTVADYDLVELILALLLDCSIRYPIAFEFHFEVIVKSLLLLDNVDEATKRIIWEFVASIGSFWSNHIPFGIQSLLVIDAELEELYQFRCEPSCPFTPIGDAKIEPKSIVLMKNFHCILGGLIQHCWGYVVANLVLHEQILHAIHWNIEISAMVGMKVYSNTWFRIVYDLLNLVLRSSVTIVVKERIDELLVNHYEYAKELFEKDNVKAIHEWLEILLILLPLNTAIIPRPIANLFQSPLTSFLMSDYRIQVCKKLNYMERLEAVTSHFLSLNVPMNEWMAEVDELVHLMSMKTEKSDTNRFGKVSSLRNLIAFDISCIGSAGSSDTQRGILLFRCLMKLHQRMTEELGMDGASAWSRIESRCLLSMLNLATKNGFFFPRLNVPVDAYVETNDLIEYQLLILKRLATPNHFGHNSMGLLWLKSWILFIKDKNYLDTLVGDSYVLCKVEQMLLRYLKKCSFQLDHLIRFEIGEIWKLYLSAFAGSRRSESNTPMIIRFFLQRIQDIHPTVKKVFFTCMCLLDSFDSIISVEHLSKALKRDYVEDFKHLVMSTPSSGAFRVKHFLQIAKYLGMSSFVMPQEDVLEECPDWDRDDNEWLRDLYVSCQSEHVFEMMKADPAVTLAGQSSHDCLLFWALWETARFFIISRLKTPFGQPLQTLEALEKTLEMYLKLFEAAKKTRGVEFAVLKFMQRMSNLLNLIDFLEIQITVASKGCTTTCPAPPKPCMVFFYSNQKVCVEWFSRIRSKVTAAASMLEEDGIILRHSFRSLFDGLGMLRERQVNNSQVWMSVMKTCLFSLHKTLVRKKDQDALVGFYTLWKRSTNQGPSELQALNPLLLKLLASGVQIAEGKVESSIRALEDVVGNNQDAKLQNHAQDQLLECYTSMGNWKSIDAALSKFSAANSNFESYFASELDALSFWNQVPDKLEPDVMSDLFNRGKSVAVEHLAFSNIYNAFIDKKTSMDESLLKYKALTGLAFSNSNEEVTSQLLWAQCMVQFNTDYKKMDTGSQIRLGKAKTSERVTNLSFYGNDLLDLMKLYSVYRSAEKIGVSRKARDPDLDEIGGLLANLARNTRNLTLAHDLLDSPHSTLTLSASLRKQYKQARLLFQERKVKEASHILIKVLSTPIPVLTVDDQEIIGKSSCLLATWNAEPKIDFTRLDCTELMQGVFGAAFPYNMSNLKGEDIEYCFFRYAIDVAPDYSKSWLTYGGFNYRLGRTFLDELGTPNSSSYFQAELYDLNELLKNSEITLEQVVKSLLKDLREGEYESETDSWKEKLDSELVDQIDQILESIRKSIFEKFDIASKAYFQYLIVHGVSNLQNEKHMRKQGDVITATLRLIRIFARYGVALNTTFHNGFVNTPLSSWKDVIPQLFSRLYHPEPFVCQEITNLLCRITTDYPHLMCYPAILGAQEVKNDNDQLIREAYDRILGTLREENASLVVEMETWMFELQRIAVLWEETWQIGLEHLHAEMTGRLAKIQRDLERIAGNTTLAELERSEIKKSTVINLMKPVLFSIEKLCEQTFRMGATTPHEVAFVEHYESTIEKGYTDLEEATEFEQVQSAWKVFHDILVKFANKQRNAPLNLDKLSPALVKLTNTNIYVPGIGLDDEKVAFCNHELRVLPTKTKPKKLELVSTTGEKYAFLLKGHDDLHLDERIQQFLGITNSLLHCDKQTRHRSLSARTYNVIPFGNNYGIIQWVENVSGLFSFYRKWQYQEYTVRNATKKGNEPIPQPPRPHEMFLRKVMAAHKEGTLDKKEPRSKWPVKVMVDIFNKLKKETPSDILSNELWTSSYSSENWWTKTNQFSRSIAVMSIIGYTLGLGDRHLDNILVDLRKGEAIHIDFNVCFEKGKRLRIPETVPFRLTQNILRALGPSGVDGHFRTACEHVLRVMRDNREILLTLLEAFIYDPLVDWTNQEGMEKQVLNLNVNIDELKSTIHEHSLELPLHSSTVIHIMRELSASLLKQKDLLQERYQLSNMSLEEQQNVLEELQERIISLEASLTDKQHSHLEKSKRHHSFYSGFKESVSQLFTKGNVVFATKDLPKNLSAKIKSYMDKRQLILGSILKQVKWYQSFLDGQTDLFLSQDLSLRMKKALALASTSGFSLESCEEAVHLLSQSLYNPKSVKTTHLADLRKALATNERRMDTLCFLKERLDEYEPSTILSLNEEISKEEIMFRCCALHLLSDLGRLVKLNVQRVDMDQELELVFDQDLQLLLESLEILHETDLIQLPEQTSPNFDLSNVIVSTCIQSITYLMSLYSQHFTSNLITDNVLDQLTYFERIYNSYYKVSILLVRDILPKCINAKAKKNDSVLLLISKIINLGKDCLQAFHPDALKFNTAAKQLKVTFEKFETEFSKDVECTLILESIHNMIAELKTSRIQSISETVQNHIFVHLMVLLGNMFEDGSKFIEKSSLLLADPTAEFTNIFDFSQTMSHPDFKSSRSSFESLMEYVTQELFYKPFFSIITNVLESLTNKLGKTVTKTWNTNSKFNESTSIQFVDHTNKYLNYFVKIGTVDYDELIQLKQHTIQQGIIRFIKNLSSKSESKSEWIQNTIEAQSNSLDRYQMLHATELFESSDSLDRLDSRVTFLDGLSKHTIELEQLDKELMEISKEVQKRLPAERTLEVIQKHQEQNEAIIKFTKSLRECEYERLPDAEMVQSTNVVVQELETLFKSKKRLETIRSHGSHQGLIQMIDNELQGLGIDDTKKSLRQLMKKLSSFFDSLKKLMEPVMRISDNIVTYAKDTNFNQDILKQIMTHKKQWRNLWEKQQLLFHNVSKYIDSNDPGVESQLEKDISKLSESGIDLLEKVLDYADIEEITFEEFNDQESESSEDEENITMRMNRGQEKNMTAMAVLKQIKAKLEGRDNSDRSRITVQEQVHGLIMEATSTEKLALMYEGWMAWI